VSHTIERLGHLGDGIAAGPVFAPLTLPGEVIDGDIIAGRIAAAKIITPSADRVRAPCSHFKTCGGCNLQHASDTFVAGWKADVVRAGLLAHGLDAPITKISTSPAKSRRRATLSGRRTKKGATIGFHARSSDTVVDIVDCQLLTSDLMAALPLLRDITVLASSRKGEVSFQVTQSPVGIDLAVNGAKALDDRLRLHLPALVEKHGAARLTWDGELVAQREPPRQNFGPARVLPPAHAFLQATEHGQAALVAAVTRAVGSAQHIVDLFAGCGTFALPLSANAEVRAVEGDDEMLAALDGGWRNATGLKKVTTEVRDLFRRPLMPDELKRFDAVVIDPPRAGAEAQIKELAKSNVAVIAAVSCNPVTFGRDAKILCNSGYSIDWIEVVDQFRWSPHVELVAKLSRAT
jgi:23S rRNA (uracil1939-C5)-methyltransferase